MRWEDERYVRVYTRDTGDWLDLSFEAQALFLLLLRKVDRIGELRLGKRGRSAIAALVGHLGRESLTAALDELLTDGCVQLREDGVLFVRNFLKAQEAPKSSTERKREQRERDAALAAAKPQMSRVSRSDVTERDTRDIGHSGHEMSPRAVPSRAVPSEPVRVTADPVSAPGALNLPGLAEAAVPGRRAEDRPPPRPRLEPTVEPIEDEWDVQLKAAWKGVRGSDYDWKTKKDGDAVRDLLRLSNGSLSTALTVWRKALGRPFPHCRHLTDLAENWSDYAGADPPKGKTDTRFTPAADRGPIGDRRPA